VLIDVRTLSAAVVGLTLLLVTAIYVQRVDGEVPHEPAVFRIEIIHASETTNATGFLVHEERHGTSSLVYLLTAAHPFRRIDDEAATGERRIRVRLSDVRAIEVKARDVVPAPGNMMDLALLEAVSPNTDFVALPLMFEPPPPGGGFVIFGYRQDGTRATISERVRFVSTLFVVGDRDVSDLSGCAGAPALVENLVFGIVSECAVDRTPTITALTLARGFIMRNIPGLVARPTTSR
jgi:hypothetical protein